MNAGTGLAQKGPRKTSGKGGGSPLALDLAGVRMTDLTPGDLWLCVRLQQNPLDDEALADLCERVEYLAPMMGEAEAATLARVVETYREQARLARLALEAGYPDAGEFLSGDRRLARLDVLEAMAAKGLLTGEELRIGNDLSARLLAGPGAAAAQAIDYAALRVDGGTSPGDMTGPKGWNGQDAKIWREAVAPWRAELAARPLWSLTSEENRQRWDGGNRRAPGNKSCRTMALEPIAAILTGQQIVLAARKAGISREGLKNAIPPCIALYGEKLRSTFNFPLDLMGAHEA